jgi:hypothetical protein
VHARDKAPTLERAGAVKTFNESARARDLDSREGAKRALRFRNFGRASKQTITPEALHMTVLAPPSLPPGAPALLRPTGPLSYQVLLTVTVDSTTTALTAIEHASAVIRGIEHQIHRGLLTVHERQAVIERYELVRTWPPR